MLGSGVGGREQLYDRLNTVCLGFNVDRNPMFAQVLWHPARGTSKGGLGFVILFGIPPPSSHLHPGRIFNNISRETSQQTSRVNNTEPDGR
jgi:hypothetical protein